MKCPNCSNNTASLKMDYITCMAQSIKNEVAKFTKPKWKEAYINMVVNGQNKHDAEALKGEVKR